MFDSLIFIRGFFVDDWDCMYEELADIKYINTRSFWFALADSRGLFRTSNFLIFSWAELTKFHEIPWKFQEMLTNRHLTFYYVYMYFKHIASFTIDVGWNQFCYGFRTMMMMMMMWTTSFKMKRREKGNLFFNELNNLARPENEEKILFLKFCWEMFFWDNHGGLSGIVDSDRMLIKNISKYILSLFISITRCFFYKYFFRWKIQ